mgnify:CR=1 FL=1
MPRVMLNGNVTASAAVSDRVGLAAGRDSRIAAGAAMYEADAVADGQPQARLLHRWDAHLDRFEAVDEPQLIGTEADLAAALRHFEAL